MKHAAGETAPPRAGMAALTNAYGMVKDSGGHDPRAVVDLLEGLLIEVGRLNQRVAMLELELQAFETELLGS